MHPYLDYGFDSEPGPIMFTKPSSSNTGNFGHSWLRETIDTACG